MKEMKSISQVEKIDQLSPTYIRLFACMIRFNAKPKDDCSRIALTFHNSYSFSDIAVAFKYKFINQTVQQYQQVSFRCSASGTVKWTWTLDGWFRIKFLTCFS